MNTMKTLDFTAAKPVKFEDIRKGDYIIHQDDNSIYSGFADELSMSSNWWYDTEGEAVADRSIQNYRVPFKRDPLPTTNGARIILISDHKHRTNGSPAVGNKAGAGYTLSRLTNRWVLDGYTDSHAPEWFDNVEWEHAKLVVATSA